MPVQHIHAIKIYTDEDILVTTFRTSFTFSYHDEYANWGRLLDEAVWIFGDNANNSGHESRNIYFHGLKGVYPLGYFDKTFRGPLSTTIDEEIAETFATDGGMILKLEAALSYNIRCFNVEGISNYPEERERLFFGGTFSINDISIFDSKFINNHYCDSLILLSHMVNGIMSSHGFFDKINKNPYKAQQKLCVLLNNFMNHKISNDKIERYFGDCIPKMLKNRVWICKDYLIEYMNQSCFHDEFIKLFIQYKVINGIKKFDRYGKFVRWLQHINNNQVIPGFYFKIFIDMNEINNGKIFESNDLVCNIRSNIKMVYRVKLKKLDSDQYVWELYVVSLPIINDKQCTTVTNTIGIRYKVNDQQWKVQSIIDLAEAKTTHIIETSPSLSTVKGKFYFDLSVKTSNLFDDSKNDLIGIDECHHISKTRNISQNIIHSFFILYGFYQIYKHCIK